MTYRDGANYKRVIDPLSLSVNQSEWVSIVGPSGTGKTTLLKCIAGLVRPTSGQVWINGKEVLEPPREIAFVFQDYGRSLLPWLRVVSNVALPLRGKGVGKDEALAEAADKLRAVGLSDVARQFPWQLSGGMQQRVAIARALAYRAKVLLMDEPFASVDAQTRMDLEDLVLGLRTEFGLTTLFVTHDIDEAVYVSDRVVVLVGQPASVNEVVTVDLPYPRDQVATKSSPSFARLRTRVLEAIRGNRPGSPQLSQALGAAEVGNESVACTATLEDI